MLRSDLRSPNDSRRPSVSSPCLARVFAQPLIAVLVCFSLWGCGVDPDEARFKLGELGYKLTPASLLHATDRNDHVAVRLFVLAGMHPDTEFDEQLVYRARDSESLSSEFSDWLYDRFGAISPNWEFTPLIVAAALGHQETVEVLLDAGADKDIEDGAEQTALMRATAEGHVEIVEMLLDEDDDLDDDENADRLLTFAVSNNHVEIVELLLDAGVDQFIENNLNFTALIDAADTGGIQSISILIEAGAEVDAQPEDRNGDTALIRAVRAGHADAVRLLLDEGADPNLQNAEGTTALIVAAGNTDEVGAQLVRMLLDAGADPNLRSAEGLTALSAAIDYYEPRIPMVELLLEAGADPNVGTGEATTPLMTAVRRGLVRLVEILLGAGANPEYRAYNGDTAIIEAVRGFRNEFTAWNEPDERGAFFREVILALLAAGADPNAKNEKGVTPMSIAITTGDLDFVNTLSGAGADPNAQDGEGFTPLMRAMISSLNTELRQLLLDSVGNAENADLQNNSGVTALMIAVDAGRHEVVRALLDIGADPDIQNEEGQTALMYAASKRDNESLTALLDAGADATLTDTEGKSALNYASPYDRKTRAALQEAMSRPRNRPTAPTAQADQATGPPTSAPVVEIDAESVASLTNETYLGGMKRRGMKVYAMSKDGNWCAENVIFRIRAPSADVYTDGTAEFYMKRFGERINEDQFCPAARSADVLGYTDTGIEPVFTGKASAATGWVMN